MSVNKVLLVGRLGRDPEIRHTQSGVAVATMSVATERRYKDKSGERQKQTEWITVVAFGRTAEIIEKWITKGSQIHVCGRLQTRSWEDKSSGQKRYKTEVVCEELTMLGGGRNRSSGGNSGGGNAGGGGGQDFDSAGGTDFNSTAGSEPDDDDIPF